MRIHDTMNFTFNKVTNTFVAELSDLGYGAFVPAQIYLRSHVTGKVLSFTGFAVDRDASGEDITGYRYGSDGPDHEELKVLLIND